MSWLSRYGQHVTCLEMTFFPQRLTQLQSCLNLLDLRLYGGTILLGPSADGRPGLAEGITKLTRLELRNGIIAGGGLDSLSRLVHLKHLEVAAGLSAAPLPCLQQLTHLTSHGMSLENLRQLSVLTALQELDCSAVQHIRDSPSSVTGLALPPSLTKLQLAINSSKGVEAALLPHAPTGLRALSVAVSHMDALVGPVLDCIARLQCLTRLALDACEVTAWPPAGPAYSALTASSSLVSLELGGDSPAGVWPFVFCAADRLPHLTCLVFDEGWEEADASWAFGTADLAALVSCAPGLLEIHSMCLQPGPHVSELRKLTGLTKLSAYCADGDLVGTVQGLAAVTQLRNLDVHLGEATAPLAVASLLPLTSLLRLSSLCCTLFREDLREVDHHTEAGSPPDVWLQLLQRCAAADPACQSAALCSLARQLAEQRALTAEQIAGLQAQLSAQQQRNEALHQQHMAAQHQLFAQQQVAAEQGARITALEGQLQQLLQQLP